MAGWPVYIYRHPATLQRRAAMGEFPPIEGWTSKPSKLLRIFMHAIVEHALALLAEHPDSPAIEILDRAMNGHEGTSPDFEAHPKITCALPYAYSDDTDPASPFGELLRQAFGPELDAREVLLMGLTNLAVSHDIQNRASAMADAWQGVIDRFAERYNLWNG